MGRVACRFELRRDDCHGGGDALADARRIVVVDVDVDGKPSREERRARRGAELVCVVPIEDEATGGKRVDVVRGKLPWVRIWWAVETHICPAEVIHEKDNDIGL